MRILILTTHFNAGGITSYVLNLAKGLIDKGHQVFIGSSSGNKIEEIKKIGAVHYYLNIRTKSELSPKVYFSFLKIQKFISQQKIDVIHSQTRVTQVLGSLIHRFYKLPHVSTCHGFFRPKFFRKVFPCWGQAVIAISLSVQEHLIKDFSVFHKKIFLIPHGINVRTDTPTEKDRQEKRKKLSLSSQTVVGTIARLSKVKGLDVLVNAMALIVQSAPDVKLVIAGEGKEQKALQDLVRQRGLERNILFLPAVKHIDDILSLLDIFVMPSRQEGLGLSVLEAQSRGLAVVASRVGGLVSLIEPGKTGVLVSPENPQELAQALLALIDDPNQTKRMGRLAKETVMRDFSLEKMVDLTVDVYRSVIDEKDSCL